MVDFSDYAKLDMQFEVREDSVTQLDTVAALQVNKSSHRSFC